MKYTTLCLSLSLTVCALFPSNTSANPLPPGCEYGKQTSYDIDLNNLYNGVDAGYDIYNDDSPELSYSGWYAIVNSIAQLIFSTDSLRIETPKHVLQNTTFRAKANLFDPYVYTYFSNSEKGDIGRDKSNLEANSYLNMSFDETYGYGLIWAYRSNLCSAEGVWVQKAPKFTSASASGGDMSVQGNFSYEIDQFSRAAKDSSVNAFITVIARNDEYGNTTTKTYSVNNLQGTLNYDLNLPSGGPYNIKFQVNDGTYYKTHSQSFHITVTGETNPPCQNCQPL